MKAFEIHWHDSMRTTGWRSMDEAQAELAQPDFTECASVGFLVGETDDRLMLALNRQQVDGGVPMVGETIVIPKSAITSKRELRVR